MDFLEKVLSAVSEHKMAEQGDAVVAALSGGADSVSLVFALKQLSSRLGITVAACHFNHHIRGAESDRDMRFCEELCRQLEIPLTVKEADVPSMRRKHESLEECARRARYDFFAEVSRGKCLATAHNANDCAETMLLNLMRGTGLKGLCGIPPVRGNIIRPLIYCTRAEVEDFCRSNGLTWVTDSTNLSADYTRNRVRQIILPEMLKINGSLYSTMIRAENNLREDSDFLEGMAAEALEASKCPGGFRADDLAKLPKPLQSRAIKRIFAQGGIEPSALRINTAAEILAAGKGKFNPCRGKFFTVKRGVAFVEEAEQHYRKHER